MDVLKARLLPGQTFLASYLCRAVRRRGRVVGPDNEPPGAASGRKYAQSIGEIARARVRLPHCRAAMSATTNYIQVDRARALAAFEVSADEHLALCDGDAGEAGSWERCRDRIRGVWAEFAERPAGRCGALAGVPGRAARVPTRKPGGHAMSAAAHLSDDDLAARARCCSTPGTAPISREGTPMTPQRRSWRT